MQHPPIKHPTGRIPQSVALIGAGPTMAEWPTLMASSTIEGPMVDEVWGVNTVGRGVKVDLSFIMDDYTSMRGHVPGVAEFMETADHPIITSIARKECPTAITYPLGDVLALPNAREFLNHTCAYAIAYAITIGVKQIMLFGTDYVADDYKTAASKTVPARFMGCASFWLGYAAARGIDVVVCPRSPLLDSDLHPNQKFYGYLHKPLIRRDLTPVDHTTKLAAAE